MSPTGDLSRTAANKNTIIEVLKSGTLKQRAMLCSILSMLKRHSRHWHSLDDPCFLNFNEVQWFLAQLQIMLPRMRMDLGTIRLPSAPGLDFLVAHPAQLQIVLPRIRMDLSTTGLPSALDLQFLVAHRRMSTLTLQVVNRLGLGRIANGWTRLLQPLATRASRQPTPISAAATPTCPGKYPKSTGRPIL